MPLFNFSTVENEIIWKYTRKNNTFLIRFLYKVIALCFPLLDTTAKTLQKSELFENSLQKQRNCKVCTHFAVSLFNISAISSPFSVFFAMLPYKGCLLGSPPGRLRTIRYSNVHRTFELRSCPHGFESLLFSYENKKTSKWMSFCFGAVEGIRTPMVAHTDLNRARLPIPPRPHIWLSRSRAEQSLLYNIFS